MPWGKTREAKPSLRCASTVIRHLVMSNVPLLTVVIPWRDFPSPPELASGVVRSARERGIQVVVVDDASQWGADLDARMLMQSEGADYVRLERSAGPGMARNFGLMKVHGQFVAFLDADDLPHFETLSLMAQQGDIADADVVIGGYHHVRSKEHFEWHSPGGSFVSALDDQPAIWRYVFRREFLEKHNCRFIAGNYAEDLVFLLEVLSKEPMVVTLSDLCYEYLDLRPSSQLSHRRLSTADFDSAEREIRAIPRPTASPKFEQVRNRWLIRIWFRRLRCSNDAKSLLNSLSKFPKQRGVVVAFVTLMSRYLRENA